MGGHNVRANWHLGDLELPSEGNVVPIDAIAKPIDLSGSEAELSAELRALVYKEGDFSKLFGDECEIKWSQDHRIMGGTRRSCFTCPHFTEDDLNPMTNICRIGRQQENVLAQLAAIRDHGDMDDELIEAYERDAAAAAELAEAVLA